VPIRVKPARFIVAVASVTCLAQSVLIADGFANAGSGEKGHTVRVWASTGSTRPGGGSARSGIHGSSGRPACTYVVAAPSMVVGFVAGTGPGAWYVVACSGDGLNPSDDRVIAWIANTAGAVRHSRAPLAAAEKAASSMTLPSPSVQTDPSGSAVVNLPTWLWINSSIWRQWSATARAGGVVATATATPVRVVFRTGDGGTVVCDGPGDPYDVNGPTAQHTYCSHTYRSSSAGEPDTDGNPNQAAFQVTATITWDVTWSTGGSASAGVLPALTTTSTARLRVEQIESVLDA
jgi:hypothetical protein